MKMLTKSLVIVGFGLPLCTLTIGNKSHADLDIWNQIIKYDDTMFHYHLEKEKAERLAAITKTRLFIADHIQRIEAALKVQYDEKKVRLCEDLKEQMAVLLAYPDNREEAEHVAAITKTRLLIADQILRIEAALKQEQSDEKKVQLRKFLKDQLTLLQVVRKQELARDGRSPIDEENLELDNRVRTDLI